MKKIFFAIICLGVWTCQVMAGNTLEERMDSLTRAFLSHYGDKMPEGVKISADSGTININIEEFISNPVAKRYFEQMGKEIIAEQVSDTRMKVEIQDLHMEQMELSQKGMNKAKRKAVAFPQTTFCLAIPYTYMSIDGKNNPVRLSSMLYRPSPFQFNYSAAVGAYLPGGMLLIEAIKGLWNNAVGYTFDYGILSCHPTVTSSAEAPTGSMPLDGAVNMFCSDYAIVVCPDYCGYGLSAYRQHPYLVQGVTARNVVDGYIAALDLIKQYKDNDVEGSWELANDFYTDIIGYSQGGSVALATLRYLESGLVSQDNLNRINIRNTYCGDGPYSPIATIHQYVEWANSDNEKLRNLAYPCVLPLIVQAAKEAYDNDCMRTVNVEDYFTPEFLATGIIENLNSKSVTTTQLNEVSKGKGILTLDQMLSEKIIRKETVTKNGTTTKHLVLNTESNEYKCLIRALEHNDLTIGWTPRHRLVFMHLDGDMVVPYCNMEKVRSNMTFHEKVVFTDPFEARNRMSTIWRLVNDKVKGTLDNPDHSSIGEFFYMSAAAGVFQEMLEEFK